MPVDGALAASDARSAGSAELRPVEIEELFAVYHQRVSVWVRRLGGPGIDADDGVQEVFLIAHRRLHRLKAHENIVAWLYRVTENVVLHQRRRLRRQHRLLAHRSALRPGSAELAAQQEIASDADARRQELEIVYEALDRMSERNRTLFILFEIEELSGQEIAELKGAKLATIWVWLHRARADFRNQLAALGQTSSYLRGLQR